jgi:Domain of unknown function (DUF5668)
MNFNLTPKQILTGSLLVVLGLLFLLYNLGLFSFNFNLGIIWKIWPLVLILIGAAYFVKDQKTKSILFIIVALLAGLTIFSAVTAVVNRFWPREERDKKSAPFSRSIKNASLVFKASTGEFTLKDTSRDLVSINTDLNYGDYILDKVVSGESANVRLEMQREKIPLNPFKARNDLEIKLNSTPTWDMNVDISAGSLIFDLSKFKIQNALISSKAASIDIKLGDISELTKITLNTDVSSVKLAIPKTVGAQIDGDFAVTTREFTGFDKKGDRFLTDNFENASKRVYIQLDAGASSLKIERY